MIKDGNYLIRDLQDVLTDKVCSQGDFIYSKTVTTVVCIVPKESKKKFEAEYQQKKYVVPDSAKQFDKLTEDNLTLWRVCLFKLDNEETFVKKDKDGNEVSTSKKVDPV